MADENSDKIVEKKEEAPGDVLATPPGDAVPEAPPPDEDVLFRLQVAASDFFLAYWKVAAGAVAAVMVGALAWGAWSSWKQSQLDKDFAAIAAIDYLMPRPSQMAMYGLEPLDDPSDAGRMADLEEGARRYQKVAEEGHGAAKVYAWLKSGETWERRGDKEKALQAYDAAVAVDEGDFVGFAAEGSRASALLKAGRAEEGIAAFKKMTERYQGVLAEQAWEALVEAQVAAGKEEDAKASLLAWRAAFPASIHPAVATLSKRLGVEVASTPAAPAPAAPGSPMPGNSPAETPAPATPGKEG